MRPIVAVIALMLASTPAAAQNSGTDDDVITTAWSLKSPPARAKTIRPGRSAMQARRSASRAQQQPRIFGGATMNNHGRQRAPGARVGVALPF